MLSTELSRLRARSKETRDLSRELIQDCRQAAERARRLLDQLATIRAQVQQTLREKPNASFAWLAAKDFKGLSPARKKAYLAELADHLDKEHAVTALGVARRRSSVFLTAGDSSFKTASTDT